MAAFVAALIANSASTETLRMGGVGASTAMLPPLFAAFDPKGEHQLEFIPALGSSGGLRAAADGALDIAVSGRLLKPAEKTQALTQALAIRTPLVLVTSQANPAGLNSANIADIYQSAKAKWPDGSPVHIILRPESDSETPVLGRMFPRMVQALLQARNRGEIPVAATDQDSADMAEQTHGSLASSTLTQVQMEHRKLSLIAIDGVAPSLDNLERGSYPFAKTLYFVVSPEAGPLAGRFIAFLRSTEGQAALRATGTLLAAD
jgi:phosphate transport system substrate-binding protein